MPPMSFGTLTIVTAEGQSRTLTIDRPTLRIGRNADNDVVLDDPSVSAYHARLFASTSGISILDIGSRNGTEVDGRIIDDLTPLGPGTHVRLGTVTLRVVPPIASAPGSTSSDFVLPVFPEPPVAPPPQPTAAAVTTVQTPPPAQGPPLVRVELLPTAAKADITAGGPALLSFGATVQNLSRFVDRLDLSVEAPPWATVVVDPPFHNLKPGDTAQSRIELSVPRSHAASAGTHGIELVVRSQKRPELRFTASAEVTVTPFTDFRLELLEPRARTAWTGGRFRAQVTNLSNRAMPFNMEGLNTDGALLFRFEPDPIEVKPGERKESELRARFKLMRLFGQPRTYDFTVTGEPLDQSAPIQQAQGRLIQRPPLPPWMLSTGAILALLALLLACSSLLVRNRALIADAFRGLWAIPSPTAIVPTAAVPTVDVAASAEAVREELGQTQEAVNENLAASAQAAQQENSATQGAQASAAAATQGALQTSAAGTQTAAASAVAGTQTAQASAAAATATTFVTQVAGTATAQANATGTAIAGTQTALARTPSAAPLTPTTPTVAPPPGPAIGQVITFDRLRGIPVNNRVPIRGDEYAGQDAFFCFYRPESISGGRVIRAGTRAQPTPDGVSINDVRQLEGSSGGTTNFVFTVTWQDTPDVLIRAPGGVLARPALQERVLTVEYRTADGGAIPPGGGIATSPSDYLPQSGTVVIRIPAGSNQGQGTITVAVNADLEFEPDEVFTVELSNPSLAVTILDGQGFGTIINDDVASPTPTDTATATVTATPTATASPDPEPEPPPAGDAFDCRPPLPSGTSLRLLRAVIYPPPVTAANSAPLHSLTTDAGENELISRAIAAINFQRNVAEVNVDVWYPGGEAAAYVMFAFDERGALIATARRDAIGVPAAYQLNIRSLERPVRQIVIEARREFAGEFGGDYRFAPVVPPLLTRVELRYTTP